MKLSDRQRRVLWAFAGIESLEDVAESVGAECWGTELASVGRTAASLARKGLLSELWGFRKRYELTAEGAAWLYANVFPVGTVVFDRKHPTLPGTVTRHGERGEVFVAWYGTCVESDPCMSELDIWANPSAELREWRGGFGVIKGGQYQGVVTA